ncbi:hypothetical protein ACFWJY_39565 [Streptomyces anulatus]|uniref:hypothetical protein n=1 Tax=Streptomyces anulatus TaxID=1892 RepID=UPI003649D159
MMPVINAERVTVGRLVSDVDVFGGPEPDRAESVVRVALQVPVCLSFAELLGLLTFESGVLWEDLADDAVIRETVQIAVLDTDLTTMESYGRRAMAALRGEPKPGDASDVNMVRFTRAVALAVTRVFGVSA